MSVKITTNNVPREILDGYQLTDKEREELDYVDWLAVENGEDSFSGFRYRGEIYDLHEFTSLGFGHYLNDMGWHGYQSDSYFSGIVVKYADITDTDAGIIVGRYTS